MKKVISINNKLNQENKSKELLLLGIVDFFEREYSKLIFFNNKLQDIKVSDEEDKGLISAFVDSNYNIIEEYKSFIEEYYK